MKNKTLAYLGGTTLALGLGVFSWYLYRQYQILRNICYEFTNLVFTGFDSNSATIGITMRTSNYSYLPLVIDGGMITVYMDGMPIAAITVPRGQILSKAVTFTYLTARVDKTNLLAHGIGSIIDIISGNNFKTITLAGSVKIKVGFMRMNYPVQFSDTINNVLSSAASSQPCPPVTPLSNPYNYNK